MTAKELLIAIQLSGYTIDDNAEFLEFVKKDTKFFDKKFVDNYIIPEHDRLPTNHQSSHFYKIIEESFSILKLILSELKINFKGQVLEPCDVPLFGTADFKEFNAFVETSDDEPVIVFNEGLLRLTQKLLEIYTMEHWLIAKNKMTEQMKNLLTLNFFDIMLSFHLFSNAYYAIPLEWCNIEDLDDIGSPEKLSLLKSPFEEHLSEQDYIAFEHEIRVSTYLWIAAHEYSHIVLGHLKNNNNTSRLNLNNMEIDRFVLNRSQEFDADLLGAKITLESYYSPFLANGIYFALMCIMLGTLSKKEELYYDHPPVTERLINIFSNIKSDSSYHLSNYLNVGHIFIKKHLDFKKFIDRLKEQDISFSSIDEMQHYVYKIYSL